MTRFHFERSDGPPSNNVQTLSEPLNPFIPPQGFSGGGQVEFVASFNATVDLPNGPTGIKFNGSLGTKLYFSINFGPAQLTQFTVPSPFNMNPDPTFDNKILNVIAQDSIPTDLAWSDGANPGDAVFMIGDANNTIFEYNVPNFYDLDNFVTLKTNNQPTGLGLSTGIEFGDSGNKLYACGQFGGAGVVEQLSLSNAFTIQSGVTGPVKSTITFPDNDIRGVVVSKLGDKLMVVGRTAPATVYQYSMVNGNILTLSTNPTATFDLTNQTTSPFGITLSDDETQMFIVDAGSRTTFQYSLPSPFQL